MREEKRESKREREGERGGGREREGEGEMDLKLIKDTHFYANTAGAINVPKETDLRAKRDLYL